MTFFTTNTSSQFLTPNLDVLEKKVVNVQLGKYANDQFKNKIMVDFIVDENNWLSLHESYFALTLKSNRSNQANTAGADWDADTNTPDIDGAGPTAGDYHLVTVAGTTDLDGTNDWQVNEYAYYTGTEWEKRTSEPPANENLLRPENATYTWNPICSMFSSMQYYINNILVCESHDPLINEQFYHRIKYNKSMRESYLDALYLGDVQSRRDLMGDDAVLSHEIMYRPTCLPIFNSDLKIPPGSKHRMILHIHQDWQDRIFDADGGNIGIEHDLAVTNFRFEYQLYAGPYAPNGEIMIPLMTYDIENKLLHGSVDQMQQFSLDADARRLFFALQQHDHSSSEPTVGFSRSDFTSEEDDDHLKLEGYYFKIGEVMYPDPHINFKMDSTIEKLFKDTYNALLKDEEWESKDEWLKSPLYVVPIFNTEPNITLQLSFKNPSNPERMQVWLASEHQRILKLDYSDNILRNVSLEQ